MYKKLTVWALAATITLVVSACDDAVDPAGWYLGTEVLSKGGGVFDLSVIVLRDHKVAPDGTAVFFECSKPVLDARYDGLEVRTVGGRASVDVTPPPGAPVVVTFTLLGEEGRAGEAVLPPSVRYGLITHRLRLTSWLVPRLAPGFFASDAIDMLSTKTSTGVTQMSTSGV